MTVTPEGAAQTSVVNVPANANHSQAPTLLFIPASHDGIRNRKSAVQAS